MSRSDQAARLDQAAMAAKAAEVSGDDEQAAREWRRFRLIEDGARDAEDLLAEGIALSVASLALAESLG